MAAFVVIENRAEDAGRIEVGEAEPVNGAIFRDQGSGAKVADDPVVLDRLIGHAGLDVS